MEKADIDSMLAFANYFGEFIPGWADLLAPLAKEQLPPAGAAAPGTLPPPNIFPATWTAVEQVGAMQRGASMCATERRKLACACLYLLMLCLIYLPTYQPCPSPSFCCS